MKITTLILLGYLLVFTQGCQLFQAKSKHSYRSKQSHASFKKSSTRLWYKRHQRIEAYKKHYSKNNQAMQLWYKSKKYLPYIRSVFRQYGLPNELCLLPMIESSFDPKAKNPRAAGLWQFIEPTAKEYGLRINFFVDERFDWKKSTVAAAKYLTWLGKQFDGDWALVLAAYNMGPGAIKRAMKKQGVNDYWKLRIREETTNYVPKLVALVQIIRENTRKRS